MPEDQNWKDSLPEELKDHKGLTDVKDVNSLAQQFIDGQSMIGNSIRVPGPEAGEDAWTAFHTKLTDKVPGLIPTPDRDNPEVMGVLYDKMGRPSDAMGYEHPEGMDVAKMADFAALAHKLGLSKGQYKGMLEAINVDVTRKQEVSEEEFLTGVRALKQEWGIVYDDNLQLVNSVMKGTGAPAGMMELAASGKLPPDSIKWLYNIGNQLGTEGINFTKDENSSRVTPAEARARVQEIMGDKTGPYWDASHPQHGDYVKRVFDLNTAAAVSN